eukprot:IDg11430t1
MRSVFTAIPSGPVYRSCILHQEITNYATSISSNFHRSCPTPFSSTPALCNPELLRLAALVLPRITPLDLVSGCLLPSFFPLLCAFIHGWCLDFFSEKPAQPGPLRAIIGELLLYIGWML